MLEALMAARPSAIHTPLNKQSAALPNSSNVHRETLPLLPFMSVVKCFVTSVEPDYALPWQKCPQENCSGSGFAVEFEGNKYILTNAHVAYANTSIRVRRHGRPGRYPAVAACIGRVCDLCVLTVEDTTFWEDLPVVQFNSEIPKLDDNVTVVGYPMGGDNVCVTRGIVSRVDLMNYADVEREELLVVQVRTIPRSKVMRLTHSCNADRCSNQSRKQWWASV